MCVYVCVYVCVVWCSVYTCVCVLCILCMCICLSACVRACVCVCVCVCMYQRQKKGRRRGLTIVRGRRRASSVTVAKSRQNPTMLPPTFQPSSATHSGDPTLSGRYTRSSEQRRDGPKRAGWDQEDVSSRPRPLIKANDDRRSLSPDFICPRFPHTWPHT